MNNWIIYVENIESENLIKTKLNENKIIELRPKLYIYLIINLINNNSEDRMNVKWK